jgi:archaellum component FlaF (FlaF/FlaG flagellin family)
MLYNKIIIISFLFLFLGKSVFAQEAKKCADLTIKKVELVTKCSNSLVLMVTIDIPNDKTLVLQTFWSGDAKFNNGDILINGTYVKNFGDYGKSLSPDGTYSMPVTVPLKGKTQFTNNLIVLIDATYFVEECDENNNDASFFVK